MTAVLTRATHGKDLLHPDLFALLVADVQHDHGHDHDTAARIVDQTIVYLVACGHTPAPIGPTPLVDRGWHAFLLRTAPYREFCDRVLGTFIDHYPNDTRPSPDQQAATAARTRQALKTTGLHVDTELWSQQMPCSSCSDTKDGGDGDGCHKGCHDSQAH